MRIAAVTILALMLAPAGADDTTLDDAVRAFNAAFAAADAATLAQMLTPDYVHTNGGSGSVLDRETWLEYVRGRHAELRDGRLKITRYDSDEMLVRRHGDAAVVIGRVISEGVRNGTPFVVRVRVTQTWVLSDGRWRRAAFHDSPLAQ